LRGLRRRERLSLCAASGPRFGRLFSNHMEPSSQP
jgi:hypothetical protein